MLKKYEFGFDVGCLLLFLIIMIPNFIWFAAPAPNDVLRMDSITETLDSVASICQVLMITILCVFRNRECKKNLYITVNYNWNHLLFYVFYKLDCLLYWCCKCVCYIRLDRSSMFGIF